MNVINMSILETCGCYQKLLPLKTTGLKAAQVAAHLFHLCNLLLRPFLLTWINLDSMD